MLSLNNSILPAQLLHSSEEETIIYNGKVVKIITVFNDARGATALVENEDGDIYQVPKSSLR
ncbi:hypothetical protein HUE87_07940 [Candidatus Sulfurimonas marisnigri]|uniref:Uncharacterized protein n=1 Tax=Candidatus Sulfurimonas marisnigri TaxID=2740405 RepID=A0A7S7LYI8_9BACT|nr:hypothetical protein [Candidatus Sulfurimonas marisnigri]QOY53828.1 hypothetical protein HUE87_07940 [Candidatus Sulfurimonas marisnigri]